MISDLVGAKVSELEVEMAVQYAVLRFDVAVIDTTLVKVHDSEEDLDEVVTSQGL